MSHRSGLLYLCQHCTAVGNNSSTLLGAQEPLSAEGRKQADRFAAYFSGKAIARIYTSPEIAAVQTARAIAAATGAGVVFCQSLREIDFGDFTGCDARVLGRTTVAFPGGETFIEARSRIVELIEKVLRRHKDEPTVIIGHSLINRLAMTYFCGIAASRAHEIDSEPGSVNILKVCRGGVELCATNQNICAGILEGYNDEVCSS